MSGSTVELTAPIGIAALGLILWQTATTDAQRSVAKVLLGGAVLLLGAELVLAAIAVDWLHVGGGEGL